MDRIDLAACDHTVLRRWTSGLADGRRAEIRMGRLVDQRWFITRQGHRWSGAWAVRDERRACEQVEAWMFKHGGVWVETSRPG